MRRRSMMDYRCDRHVIGRDSGLGEGIYQRFQESLEAWFEVIDGGHLATQHLCWRPEQSYDFSDAFDQLAATMTEVKSKLRNQRVRDGELGNCISRNRKL